MSDRERIELHKSTVAALRVSIAQMGRGTFKHYGEGPTGRLDRDDTARMLQVSKRRIETHELCIALLDAA